MPRVAKLLFILMASTSFAVAKPSTDAISQSMKTNFMSSPFFKKYCHLFTDGEIVCQLNRLIDPVDRHTGENPFSPKGEPCILLNQMGVFGPSIATVAKNIRVVDQHLKIFLPETDSDDDIPDWTENDDASIGDKGDFTLEGTRQPQHRDQNSFKRPDGAYVAVTFSPTDFLELTNEFVTDETNANDYSVSLSQKAKLFETKKKTTSGSVSLNEDLSPHANGVISNVTASAILTHKVTSRSSISLNVGKSIYSSEWNTGVMLAQLLTKKLSAYVENSNSVEGGHMTVGFGGGMKLLVSNKVIISGGTAINSDKKVKLSLAINWTH